MDYDGRSVYFRYVDRYFVSFTVKGVVKGLVYYDGRLKIFDTKDCNYLGFKEVFSNGYPDRESALEAANNWFREHDFSFFAENQVLVL